MIARPLHRLLLAALLLAILGPLTAQPPAPTPPSTPPKVRLGISRRFFDGVNEGDARAALKVNALGVSQNADLTVEIAPNCIESLAAARTAFERGELDLIGLPVDELVELPVSILRPEVLTATIAGRVEDEYLLVTHRDSPFDRISRLAGRRVHLQTSIHAPLSSLWLDLLTRRENLGPAEAFFGQIATYQRPSQVALPVFFRKADAAVISHKSFNLLAELNPGIARDLRIIATSPAIVNSVLCLRAGLPDATVERLFRESLSMHENIPGRQILTLFQMDRVTRLPLSVIDSARALIAEHERLCAPPRADATPAAPR